jgi:hypothetical protein
LRTAKKKLPTKPLRGAQRLERQLCLMGARRWVPEPFLSRPHHSLALQHFSETT